MAAKKTWTVKVASNPAFCGVDVGGTQFANGTAEITDARLAAWFAEHDGYEVAEVKAGKKTAAKAEEEAPADDAGAPAEGGAE